ncbi:hypothetical protein ABID16_000693 [Rhizobium aquaticum]|uniref:Immunity MXAN-0049 protein domain-containing protein n=1 Tax=Rhizobium aquaticum TaxID=1549636 RepID=A0ABV2IV72_9HYPH
MKTRIPRYFKVYEDFHAQFGNEFTFENIDALKDDRDEFYRVEKWFEPGVSITPRISTVIKPGRKMRDIGMTQSPIWIVTNELKQFIDMVAPGKLKAKTCHTILKDGSVGPELWVCCFDLTMYQSFDQGKASGEHIFRVRNFGGYLICDDVFHRAFKERKFKGFRFKKILTPEEEAAHERKLQKAFAAFKPPETETDRRWDRLLKAIQLIDQTHSFPVQAIATRTLLRGIPLLAKIDWQTEIPKKKKNGERPINAAQTLLAVLRGGAFLWWFSHGKNNDTSREFIYIIHEIRTGPYNSISKNTITHTLERPISTALDYLEGPKVHRDLNGSICHSARGSCIGVHVATEEALGILGKLDGEEVRLKDRERWYAYMNRKLTPTEECVWLASHADVDFLVKHPGKTKELLATPLWPDGIPAFFAECWEELSQRLLDRQNEKWEIWIDWYIQRLNGGTVWRSGWEQESVMMETALWRSDVALVNSSLQQAKELQGKNFFASLGRILRLSS